MKALVKEKPEPGLALRDIPEPGIVRPDDVLFEVAACAICTGEMKVYEWETWAAQDTTIQLPTVLGHEAAGVVRDVGRDVTRVKPGDRIVVDPIIGCGACRHCRDGFHNMCPDREIYGKRRGAMAEAAVLPERALCAMPGDLAAPEAAMLENLGIAVHAVEENGLVEGDVAVVIGAGPIGILAAQTLVACGMRTILSDLDAHRIGKAEACSGAHVVNGREVNLGEVVLEMTNGQGADFVLEAAATSSALELALDIVRPRGTVVTIGTFDRDVAFNPFFRMTRREIRLQSRMGRSDGTWRRVEQLVADGKVNLAPLVSKTYGLEHFEAAFKAAGRMDVMKVVFVP